MTSGRRGSTRRPARLLAVALVLGGISLASTVWVVGSGRSTADGAGRSIPSVGRYSVYEISLPSAGPAVANPWEDVTVEVVFRAPSRNFSVGGFYYEPNTWKVRVAPDELGRWRWTATINDGRRTTTAEGAFTVVDNGEAGFVNRNPTNPLRFVTSDGNAFNPIGFGSSLSDDTANGTPFDEIGFDGDLPSKCSSDPRCITVIRHDGSVRWSGWVTDLDTKLRAFGQDGAGFNLYRWSVNNASFNLFDKIDPGGNVYLEREGKWGDELVQKLRANGIRVFMTMLGFSAPYAGDATHPFDEETRAAGLEAVKRYARYIVDRYGAYVDVWELMNEVSHVPDAYATELGAAIRQRDPYRHLISTSWEKPELTAIEIVAPHWYATEDERESDAQMREFIDARKRFAKPIIVAEQGNDRANWDPRSAVRYRLRSWSALFNEASLISWDYSALKDPESAFGAIYLGPEERGYVRVLSRFSASVRPDAAVAPVTVTSGLRAYGLKGATAAWAYVVRPAGGDVTRPTLTLTSPIRGVARFISPSDGADLGSSEVVEGSNVLSLPPFTTDVAVVVER